MLKPKRILIVEDEWLTASSLKLDLEEMGFHVLDPVGSGEEAVNVSRKAPADLILMDIRLAGEIDGIEAAETITRERRIPIVFMTGYATEDIKDRARKVQPIGFLEKPIGIDEIIRIVEGMA